MCLFYNKSEHSPLRKELLPLKTHLFGFDWLEWAHLSAHCAAGSVHLLWPPPAREWRPTAPQRQKTTTKTFVKKRNDIHDNLKRVWQLTLASKMHKVVSICWMRRDMFASFCGGNVDILEWSSSNHEGFTHFDTDKFKVNRV